MACRKRLGTDRGDESANGAAGRGEAHRSHRSVVAHEDRGSGSEDHGAGSEAGGSGGPADS